MSNSNILRRLAARKFAEKWRGRGNEKEDTQSFWLELLRTVVGMEDVTTAVRFEQRTVDRGYTDVVIADAKTFIEQKSLGVDLDKPELRQNRLVTPFEQAKAYADSMPNVHRPDTIIVCDFNEFRIHDLAETEKPGERYVSFTLDELDEYLYLLDFLVDPQRSRRARETRVSLAAGELIGKLHNLLCGQYLDPDSSESQHDLNVLCVRLVFCLFAEDAGIFPKDAFHDYLQAFTEDQLRPALKDLFDWLDTSDSDRDPYASNALNRFPYVNGGLFRDAQLNEIPRFTSQIKNVLLTEASEDTNWANISPTVFGGVFEGTLNPETRRKGGMHYTSPENIHKVIDPLFLDDLTNELEHILDDHTVTPRTQRRRLEKYHAKLGSLTFFDPACGSGNFLTETYLSLRRLENKVLSVQRGGQSGFDFEEVGDSPVKVSLSQFCGLEINDFAVTVAETALWISELQANVETQTIVSGAIDDLPLRESARIIHANALQMPWEEVIAPEDCDYIIGNPPFLGARNQSKGQKSDVQAVFADIGTTKGTGDLDLVTTWYARAAQYIADYPIRCAFVSTNSICQGSQVAPVWSRIWDLGVRIDFAYDTFRWDTESKDPAHVFVVVVGFSKQGGPKRLYHHATPDASAELQRVERINAYLIEAPDVFIWSRTAPLCDVPRIGIGNKPVAGQHLYFTEDQRDAFLEEEPAAGEFMHPYVGSQEFIKGIKGSSRFGVRR